MFFGPLNNPKNKHLPDLNVRETLALAPLVALIFVIGFFPNLFLDRMNGRGRRVLDRSRRSRAGERCADEQRRELRHARAAPRRSARSAATPKPPEAEAAAPTPQARDRGARHERSLLALSPLLVVARRRAAADARRGVRQARSREGSVRRRRRRRRRRRVASSRSAARSSCSPARVLSIAVWLVGPEKLDGVDALAPYLVIDRFTLFFTLRALPRRRARGAARRRLPARARARARRVLPAARCSRRSARWCSPPPATCSALFVGARDDVARRLRLIGLPPRQRRARPRRALKYFLLGSFAAALLLFGGALLYGATGHTDLAGIGEARAASAARAARQRAARCSSRWC